MAASKCNVKQNAIEYLKKNSIISDNLFIKSPMFFIENDKLTDYARTKYGIVAEGKMFNRKRLLFNDMMGGVYDEFKAEPNEEFFKELQEKFDAVEGQQEETEQLTEVKPGVTELFDSTPELANAVYEAAGFIEPFRQEFTKIVAERINKTPIGKSFSIQEAAPRTYMPYVIKQGENKFYIVGNSEIYTLEELYDYLLDNFQEPITPQQKQQAQQLYSQYLDSIFPKNKILYHASIDKFDVFDFGKTYKPSKDFGGGFYLADKETIEQWSQYAEQDVFRNELKYKEKVYKDIAKQFDIEYPYRDLDFEDRYASLDLPSYRTYFLDNISKISFGKESKFNEKQKKAREILEETVKLRYSSEGSNLTDEEIDDIFYNKLIENKVIKPYKGEKPSSKAFIIPVLTDFSRPMLETDSMNFEEITEEELSKYDAFYELDGKGFIDQIVFNKPERDTKILGTQKDIEGFKKFVKESPTQETKAPSIFKSESFANSVYETVSDEITEEEKRDVEDLYSVYKSQRNPNIEDESELDLQEFKKYLEDISEKYSDYVDENPTTEKSENFLFNDDETFGRQIEDETEDDGLEYQLIEDEPIVNEPPEITIDEKIRKFLEKIGVSVRAVDQVRDRDGNLVDARAKADMLNKLIEVVADRQLIDTLPEEAAHMFVNMLGEESPLYREMFSKITNYKLYSQTVETYRKNKDYRKADGTLNIDKLKKEAIVKVIAQHIIGNNTGLETKENINKLYAWWSKVWNYVKSFFIAVDENPFETSAQKILEANVEDLNKDYTENEIYYQLVEPLEGLLADQQNIKLDDSVDPRTGQKRHIYTYKGEATKGSVTSYYVDPWLKKIFRSDQRSELQKMIDLIKADYGDDIHLQIKYLIDSWTNDDGTKRTSQKNVQKVVPAGPIYMALNKYVQEVLGTYDNTTKFFTEVKVFDQQKKIAGSIDLLVVKSDGAVDIYDWKSQEIFRDQDDIKTYKEPMYRIQLENYKKILEKQYGFKKFDRVRAIPIRANFLYKNNEIYNIRSIEIGDIDPTKIPDDKSYLLPVTLKDERTDDEDLDILIKKLNGVFSKIENSSYPSEEKYRKREELNQLRLAIRDLRLKTKIDKLISFGLTQYKKYSELLEANKLTGREASEALRLLDVFAQSNNLIFNLREEYARILQQKGDKKEIAKFEAVNKNYSNMVFQVNGLVKKINTYQNQKVKEKAGAKGIKGVLDPEGALGDIAGTFQALSKINRGSFKLFSNLLRRAQTSRDVKYEDALKNLTKLKKDFIKWADSRGLSNTDAINKLLQLDDKGNWNGNFVNKHESQYYIQRSEAIKSGNIKWFLDNTEFDDEAYLKREKEEYESLKKITFYLDEKENKEAIEKKMQNWKNLYKIIDKKGNINFTALSNEKNFFLKPVDKWITKEWKELQKPENAPLKKMYDYFQSLLSYSKELGMIDGNVRGFIPSLNATKIDQLTFGGFSDIFSKKGIFEDLEVDSGTMYTPQIDPTDGTIVNKIPVYFTKDLGVKREDNTMDYSKKSRDLFKIFGVWAGHMYNYEAMQSLEDDALMILNVEKNKGSLVTDNFGNVKIENGIVEKIDKNDINAQYLEDFINYYLYNKLSDKQTDTKVKIKGKEYSLLKGTQTAMSWFSLKTLALNPISGTANLVGGLGNILFTAQKGIVYTKRTWLDATYRLTSKDKKTWAALKYFNILSEGTGNNLLDDLSLARGNKVLSKNNLYFIQRFSDRAVEYPSAVAMMLENMIEGDKIVSIQQFVKNKYNYNETFYNLPKGERDALKKKMDAEVADLKKNRSLLAVGTLNNEGEFELPGIKKDSEAYAAFREKIKGINKKIIGNQSREDINRIRTTLLGNAAMQFRNWIPEMIEERFNGLKFDEETQTWTYGRFRQFMGDLISARLPKLLMAIVNTAGIGDTSIIELAKQKYQDLKAEAYEKGQAFDITEGEFIDLYVGNLKALISEVLVIAGIWMTWTSITSGDDEKKTGFKKYVSRALKKYYNEFAFYYNPLELSKIIDKPLPVIGLATDMFTFGKNLGMEGFGQAFGDEEMAEKAKPLKYFNKMVPINKELMIFYAVYDDQFRKDWDIKIE